MRTKDSPLDILFDLFLMVPTYVGPIVAAASYPVFRWLIPWLLYGGQSDRSVDTLRHLLSTFVQTLAPFAPVLILLVWMAAEIKKRVDRRRLNNTDSLADIENMSWRDFELLVAEAYRRKGYVVEDGSSPSGDGGVDIVLHANGQKTLVQCKHWKQRQVGVKVVRELYGVMHDQGVARGVIVCFGNYTREARRFSERNGIELVTGHELESLVLETRYSSGSSQSKQPLQPKSGFAKVPVCQKVAPPICPTCGCEMVLRTARRGQNAGGQLWGCSQFPRCRGTRPV